ncbi:MAG: GDP-mannose 4,6-dehydratase [Planctomycetaceae bacterium]
MSRVALITGVTGQDGTYLAEFLLEKGYSVHGTVFSERAVAIPNVITHHADLTDGSNLESIIDDVRPDEVYNFAAQSHVPLSFEKPVYTANVTGLGALRMLEAIHLHQQRTGRSVRFFQASSSAMFDTAQSPQNEQTPFHPRNPYACAKAFAHWQTINYREAYGVFACNGILFNHESPRRPERFVSRKITRAAARIKLGLQATLAMGNLDAQRDWGFAGDYVAAMWLMLQHESPDDYVIATGQAHSVREFVEEAFGYLDLDYREHVELDPQFSRPADADVLCGDASKIRHVLGWEPKVTFRELARMMTDYDLELARHEK